jgi:ABC-type bacteriocin/lantibiotic exporter with double-glycine peptidase domain
LENYLQKQAIEIENLSITMDRQPIFSGLNLRVGQGRKTTLVGKSGSGKSTLLRTLLGFVVPDAGTIRIFGRELNRYSVWELRRHMAYVAQEPEMTPGKVRHVLEAPFAFKNNRHLQEELKHLPALLDRIQLSPGILSKDFSDLSGGEKQRIALISALLLNREILLLDEASSALDHAAKHAVIDLLKASESLTVLSVSHDREWMDFSNDVVELTKAEQQEAGP